SGAEAATVIASSLGPARSGNASAAAMSEIPPFPEASKKILEKEGEFE
ncbi:unnamed protein product, partial [marine sediment metagenome]